MKLAYLLLGAAACGSPTPTDESGAVDPWSMPESGRITLDVGDAVLSARYWPAAQEGAPVLVLMNTPDEGPSDGDYPLSMVQAMEAEGWSVIVTERRGTRNSTGTRPNFLSGADVRDLELWARKVSDDGYGPLAIVDPYGAASTALTNGVAAGTRDAPLPCSVTLMNAPGADQLALVSDTPHGVRRLFQYYWAGGSQPPAGAWAESMRQHDPGNWVWKRSEDTLATPVDRGIAYMDYPHTVDEVMEYHRDTFPNCIAGMD